MSDFDALAAGSELAGRYRVEQRIGAGRFSAVYRALDARTHSRVALKVLDPFLAQDAVQLERFRREVQILRALDHPHIAQLYEFIEAPPLRAIAMQWIDGPDAAALLARQGPLELSAFLRIARGIAAALAACARAGVLHRDLKPQNILVDPHGEARLVDFGVSKLHSMSDLTRTGTAVGSPAYMAPELFRSSRADPRSDLYAAGALFFELLAGRPPFLGQALAGVLAQQLARELPDLCELRPDVPRWLERIVRKCLQPDPERRYASAAELGAELASAERARAAFELAQRASCLHCAAEQIPGLGFCHGCGRLGESGAEPGEYSLVLYRAERPALLAAQLARRAPGRDPRELAAALARPPVLILRGVSEASALALCSELSPLLCELSVVRALPARLRLPARTAGLGLGLLAGSYAAGAALFGPALAHSALQASGLASSALGTSLLAIALAYRRRLRPLLATGPARGAADPLALRRLELARAVADLQLPDVRLRLGELCAHALALRADPGEAPQDVTALEHVLEQCFEIGRQLERYELYLGSRTRLQLAHALAAAQLQLRAAAPADAARVAQLARRRAELQSELAQYCELEQLHADSLRALLAAAAALQTRRHALACGDPCAPLGEELRALAAELDTQRAPPAQQGHGYSPRGSPGPS